MLTRDSVTSVMQILRTESCLSDFLCSNVTLSCLSS
jgi:hypothetical protein